MVLGYPLTSRQSRRVWLPDWRAHTGRALRRHPLQVISPLPPHLL